MKRLVPALMQQNRYKNDKEQKEEKKEFQIECSGWEWKKTRIRKKTLQTLGMFNKTIHTIVCCVYVFE